MDRGLALAFTVLAATLWGTSFPANELGLGATDPWTFMVLRFGIAFATVALAAALLGAWDAGWLRNKWVWAVGLANAVSFQLQFIGQDLNTPGAAALMINAGNLAVPLFAYMVHRERLRGAKAPAVALAALGVVLVSTGGDLGAVAGAPFLGNMITLVAGLAFALVIVLNKAAVEGKDDDRSMVSLVVWITGITALLGLPGALLFGSWATPPQALLAAGYTGVVTTTIAFLLWSAALRYISSVVSGLVLLLEVVVALVASIALGLEAATLAGAAGAACILGAIWLVSRSATDGNPGPATAATAQGPDAPRP